MFHEVIEMSEHEDFEAEVMDLVRDVLSEFGPPLQDRGLNCVLHPLKRENCGDSKYCSEVTIDFKDDKGIVDVLEFHTVRDGRRLATVQEVETWLRQEIEGIT